MMKKFTLTLIVILFPALLFAQLPKHLEGKMTYPVFDFSPFAGVVKTKAKALEYDKNLQYKIALDVADAISDSSQVMGTLREVARCYNLNIANGVPKRKLTMAVVIHGGAIQGILNNEAYQEKFGIPNPNIAVIKEMKKAGIEFYVCAQILAYRQVPEDHIMKEVDLAISAKTALITLDQMGYTYMNVNDK
jgi:intracellular sulfur oxidation DsrE/DsrF family protein